MIIKGENKKEIIVNKVRGQLDHACHLLLYHISSGALDVQDKIQHYCIISIFMIIVVKNNHVIIFLYLNLLSHSLLSHPIRKIIVFVFCETLSATTPFIVLKFRINNTNASLRNFF